jgi:hypothetical protein
MIFIFLSGGMIVSCRNDPTTVPTITRSFAPEKTAPPNERTDPESYHHDLTISGNDQVSHDEQHSHHHTNTY